MTLVQCIDCWAIGEPDRTGRCSVCTSDAVTRRIFVGDQNGISESSSMGESGSVEPGGRSSSLDFRRSSTSSLTVFG